MKTTFATALLVFATQAASIEKPNLISATRDLEFSYATYLSKFNKTYNSVTEFEKRKNFFAETQAFIKQHNNDPKQTFTVGHNMFSDMTTQERQARLGLKYE